MWFVKFNDGACILGRTADGRETSFSAVLSRLSEVSVIGYTIDQIHVELDLTLGTMKLNGGMPFGIMRKSDFEQLIDIRPIYFVREMVNLTPAKSATAVGEELFTAIGFQGNRPDGSNVKRILEIRKDGTFDLVDN